MTPPSPPWMRIVPVDNTDSSNSVMYNITLPEVLDYNATIWVSSYQICTGLCSNPFIVIMMIISIVIGMAVKIVLILLVVKFKCTVYVYSLSPHWCNEAQIVRHPS